MQPCHGPRLDEDRPRVLPLTHMTCSLRVSKRDGGAALESGARGAWRGAATCSPHLKASATFARQSVRVVPHRLSGCHEIRCRQVGAVVAAALEDVHAIGARSSGATVPAGKRIGQSQYARCLSWRGENAPRRSAVAPARKIIELAHVTVNNGAVVRQRWHVKDDAGDVGDVGLVGAEGLQARLIHGRRRQHGLVRALRRHVGFVHNLKRKSRCNGSSGRERDHDGHPERHGYAKWGSCGKLLSAGTYESKRSRDDWFRCAAQRSGCDLAARNFCCEHCETLERRSWRDAASYAQQSPRAAVLRMRERRYARTGRPEDCS